MSYLSMQSHILKNSTYRKLAQPGIASGHKKQQLFPGQHSSMSFPPYLGMHTSRICGLFSHLRTLPLVPKLLLH